MAQDIYLLATKPNLQLSDTNHRNFPTAIGGVPNTSKCSFTSMGNGLSFYLLESNRIIIIRPNFRDEIRKKSPTCFFHLRY